MNSALAALPQTLHTVDPPQPARARSVRAGPIAAAVAIVLGFWVFAIALQLQAHAYTSEFSGYPDEPAHYTTGLMIRDYIAAGLPAHPMRYARDYYFHYPKVGLGHWPPLFYMAEAAWMLGFTESRTSVLVLMALFTAIVGALIAWRLQRRFGWSAAIFGGALFIALPLVQDQTAMVMIESLLTIFSFLAAVAFGRYLESENRRDSALFGLFTFLAIMTKGNGWALVLMAPLALLFSRKSYLFFQRSFWAGPLLIGLALPWQLFTMSMVREGWAGHLGPAYTLMGLKYFTLVIIQSAGVPLFCVALAGIALTCFMTLRRGESMAGEWAAMLALILSVIVFHSLVPAGLEQRKVVMGLPAFILFIIAGADALRRGLSPRMPGVAGPLIWCGLALLFAASGFRVPMKPALNVGNTARVLASQPNLKNAAFLVSGDSTFEGVFISEVEMHEKRPGHVILRASKVLARTDWNVSTYQLLYKTPEQIMQYLDGLPIDVIALQPDSSMPSLKHHALLVQGLEKDPEHWSLIDPGRFGPVNTPAGIRIFQRTQLISAGAGRLRKDLGQLQSAMNR